MHSTRGRSMDTAVGEALAAALQQGAAAVVGDSASGAAAVLHPDFGTAADVCANKAPRAVTETYGACAAEASEQAGAAAGARSGGDDGSVPELLGYACDAFMPQSAAACVSRERRCIAPVLYP